MAVCRGRARGRKWLSQMVAACETFLRGQKGEENQECHLVGLGQLGGGVRRKIRSVLNWKKSKRKNRFVTGENLRAWAKMLQVLRAPGSP